MVLTLLWRILPPVIDTTNKVVGNVVHSLLYFKFNPSINRTDIIRSIMNTWAINIGKRQIIVRSRIFTFEYWQNDMLAHVHGQCNILCGVAWLLFLCVDYFIFASFPQIICLDYFQMWWKYVPLWFMYCVFFTSNSTSVMTLGLFLSSSTA